MTIQVKLTPALEKFAEDCVAEGRFGDMSEVVETALSLMREQETLRQAFVQSLEDARAEAERDGYFTIEEVVAEMEAVIDEVEAERTREAATTQS